MEIRDTEKKLITSGKKGFNSDQMPLGIVLGLFAPAVTLFGFYLVNFSHISIRQFIAHLFLMHIQSSLLSLCVISNLLVFFIFIWSEKYLSARGVLLSTFLYGGLVAYLKYFS